jgi:hypothetical protein
LRRVRTAERIEKACPEATFWKIEGYEHVGAYAHPHYRERLLNFLRTSEAQGSTHTLEVVLVSRSLREWIALA